MINDSFNYKKLTVHDNLEKFYYLVAVIYAILFVLIPFIGYADLIDHFIGATAIIIGVFSFIHTSTLYGLKSKEGWSWLVLTSSLIMILLATLSDFLLDDYYFILRFISIPLLVLGLAIKLWFTGINLDTSQKTVDFITFLGWGLLIMVSILIPILEGNLTTEQNPYYFYGLAEFFSLFLGVLVIQNVKAKGWYIVSVGLIMISLGDIFHPFGEMYGLLYPGSPYRLLWYLGILTAAYGSFYQRREHIKLISL